MKEDSTEKYYCQIKKAHRLREQNQNEEIFLSLSTLFFTTKIISSLLHDHHISCIELDYENVIILNDFKFYSYN